MNQNTSFSLAAVVPAAGVGKRMAADRPKQYLLLEQQTVLEHTLDRLLGYPPIDRVVVVLHPDDCWFEALPVSRHPRLVTVTGGAERADSVLAGLRIVEHAWVMVHDAARPAITHRDLDKLLESVRHHGQEDGAILAVPVKDTMKRANEYGRSAATVEREGLWHALTPQLFPTGPLRAALIAAAAAGARVTDESSAMELAGYRPLLVEGRADNIKLTQPEDLALMAWYLRHQRPPGRQTQECKHI